MKIKIGLISLLDFLRASPPVYKLPSTCHRNILIASSTKYLHVIWLQPCAWCVDQTPPMMINGTRKHRLCNWKVNWCTLLPGSSSSRLYCVRVLWSRKQIAGAGLAASSSSQYPRPPAAPRMGEPGPGVVTIRAGDNPSRRFHYHGEGLGPSAVVVHLHIRQ